MQNMSLTNCCFSRFIRGLDSNKQIDYIHNYFCRKVRHVEKQPEIDIESLHCLCVGTEIVVCVS